MCYLHLTNEAIFLANNCSHLVGRQINNHSITHIAIVPAKTPKPDKFWEEFGNGYLDNETISKVFGGLRCLQVLGVCMDKDSGKCSYFEPVENLISESDMSKIKEEYLSYMLLHYPLPLISYAITITFSMNDLPSFSRKVII